MAAKNATFDTARQSLLTTVGTTLYPVSHEAIQQMPQGDNQPIDKVLLQTPGVSQDSAASGTLHVRNEHGNVQYRINGIFLPDGVSGLATFLDTAVIGNMSLITGALPAEYGLRSAGLIDIQTRTDVFNNTGSVGVYGGSQRTFTAGIEYGGTYAGDCASTPATPGYFVKSVPSSVGGPCAGATQYFFMARYLQSIHGIENPAATFNAIHDFTQQGRGFGYLSTVIDDTSRLSLIVGTSNSKFQIPDNPGQMPTYSVFGITDFNSANINENQTEHTHFGTLAWQKSANNVDLQLAAYSRYTDLVFTPDPVADLMFNGVASNVSRRAFANGIQGDGSYHIGDSNTVRAGFFAQAEQTKASSVSSLLPIDTSDPTLPQLSDQPFSVAESVSKVGWLLGAYVQDEWKVTSQLTVNVGVRFDQMYQFVDANQFSPRFNVVYKPFETTTFHAGYARNFTPPQQIEAASRNTDLYTGTVLEPGVPGPYGAVLPERSNVVDAGIEQVVFPGLKVGVDAYYKRAKDLIDDGQFGAALVLDAFNYQVGENAGAEFSAKYTSGSFSAYANFAAARQVAKIPNSNQYLWDPDEYAFALVNYVHTDHAQTYTGSAGASYGFCGSTAPTDLMYTKAPTAPDWWCGTRVSADMIYGSGLRSGFANTDHVPPYTQFNLGITKDFTIISNKPTTLRFDVVNVFDTIYLIRDGSGIGVFAPQYGPRRGYYAGLSQKF